MRRGLICVVVVSAAWAAPPAAPSNIIGYHEVKLDASGRIVPWHGSGPAEAYDHVVRLVGDFWQKMRKCPNGVPYYLQHQVWKPDVDDPRGLEGDQIPDQHFPDQPRPLARFVQ